MGSAHLSDFIDNAEFELEVLIPAGQQGELDARGIQLLCDTFRQRGVCSFLLTGDTRPFYVNAMQSAGAYVAYVERAEDAHKVTSQAKPFYDAVGCGFWDCAKRIAESSRTEWNRPKEYEEDFLFVLFLMKHFFMNAGEDESRAIIAQHDEAAEGQDQAHRSICRAFLERDAELFDASLRQLLQERSDRVEGMIERDAIPEEHWSWLRYFSSEGFGLLSLAERASFPMGTEYLHVSESLRRGTNLDFDPNAWQQLRY